MLGQLGMELSQIPMSQALAATLARAFEGTRVTGAGEVSLEHLLAALCDDPDAADVLFASQVDVPRLKSEVIGYLSRAVPQGMRAPADISLAPQVRRILEAAAAAARGGRRKDINGAIVLAAIVGDGKSAAAQMLQARGLTFDEAIRALQAALKEPSREPPPPADDVLARARERVQSRSAPSLREIMNDLPRPSALPPPPQTTPSLPAGSDILALPEPASHAEFEIDEMLAQPVQEEDEDIATVEIVQPKKAAPVAAEPKEPPPAAPTPVTAPEPVQAAPAPPISVPAAAPAAAAPSQSAPQSPPVAAPVAPNQAHPRDGYTYPAAPPVSDRPAIPTPPPIPPPIPKSGQPPNFGNPTPPMAPARFPVPGDAPFSPFPPMPGSAGSMPRGGMPNMRPGMPQVMPPPSAPHLRPPMPGQMPAQMPQQMPGPMSAPISSAPRMPAQGGRDQAPAKTELGELAENVPRAMRVGNSERVEIRIARGKVKALTENLEGGGLAWRHDVVITKAMSVRLRAPEGGFFIETASPETQWIDNQFGEAADDYASWRFLVTPNKRGWAQLQIIVSARTVGGDGLAAETAFPDQVIDVKIKTNYKRAFLRWSGWILAAVAGGAFAKFGDGAFTLVSGYVLKFLSP